MNAVILPENLTEKEIDDIMLSYDHSYGLTVTEEYREEDCLLLCGYTEQERELVRSQVAELYRLIKRTLQENCAMNLTPDEIIDYNRRLIAKNLNHPLKPPHRKPEDVSTEDWMDMIRAEEEDKAYLDWYLGKKS